MVRLSLTTFALAVIAFGIIGCDTGSPPPPPPPISSGEESADSETSAALLPPPPSLNRGGAEIAFVFPRAADGTMALWEQVARRIVGKSGAVIEALKPTPEGSDDQQAKLIAQAVRSGIDGILVVPETGPSPGLSDALAAAKKRGIPILSLAQPLADGDQSAPMIARADAVPPARLMAKALVDDAGIVGLSQSGPVLVLLNEIGPEAAIREAAIIQALGDIGLPLFGGAPRRFNGRFEEAQAIIKDALKQDPKLPMILVADDVAFRGAMSIRNELPPSERFVFAGFVADPENVKTIKSSHSSAGVDCNEAVLGRIAAEKIIAARNGEALPPRIDVELKFIRAPGPPSGEEYTNDEGLRKVAPVAGRN
jgi:ABC-type sugar transport system substrate-binding protein